MWGNERSPSRSSVGPVFALVPRKERTVINSNAMAMARLGGLLILHRYRDGSLDIVRSHSSGLTNSRSTMRVTDRYRHESGAFANSAQVSQAPEAATGCTVQYLSSMSEHVARLAGGVRPVGRKRPFF